jgi:hypothetical protein
LDERVWFYAEADQQHGPLSLEQLAKTLAVRGQPREVLVWRDGLAAWAAAGEVPELLERLSAQPVWHVAEDGQTKGPLTLDGLLGALVGRQDPGGAMVWRAGLEAWKPAREVAELAGQLPPPIPVAPRAGRTTIATQRRPDAGSVPATAGGRLPAASEGADAASSEAPPEADLAVAQGAPSPRPPRFPPAVARRGRQGFLSPKRLGMFGVAVVVGYGVAALLTSGSGSRGSSPAPAAGTDAGQAAPGAPTAGQTPIDPERYRSACNTGVALACTHLGTAYMDGLGVPADPVQGRELLRRGCEGDSALGCYALAAALEAMSEGTPSPSVLALYQKACQLGHAPACEAAGRR